SMEIPSACVTAYRSTARGKADSRCRHEDSSRGDCSNKDKRIQRLGVAQRRPFDPSEQIDGNTFGMGIQCGELMQESDAILVRFTHTDDAATAHRNTGFPNVFNRAQSVFVGSGRNDLAIKLRRCVEVMVVSMQPC